MAEEHIKEEYHTGAPRWTAPAVIVLGILAVIAIGISWTAMNRSQQVNQALSTDITTLKQSAAQDVQALQQRLTIAEKANGDLQSDLGVVTKRLRVTRGELKKAREEDAQIREDSAKQIADMGSAVKTELATKASNEDVKAVTGEVSGVKTDLENTKQNLQMAKSEFGTLIARNHEEIDTLRRLGQRDYVEFNITSRNKPQQVGSVTVELKSVNPKKNQFTLALVVEDVRTEKKNRTVNEPIFFYTKGARQPLELVVNQVAKDKIVGYLSIPKANQQSTSGD
jgi:hypothetical protein